jgi:hypothetical protein
VLSIGERGRKGAVTEKYWGCMRGGSEAQKVAVTNTETSCSGLCGCSKQEECD